MGGYVRVRYLILCDVDKRLQHRLNARPYYVNIDSFFYQTDEKYNAIS